MTNLFFDVADNELEFLVPEVIKIMETKADFIVPLKVNVTAGKNWLDQVEYVPFKFQVHEPH